MLALVLLVSAQPAAAASGHRATVIDGVALLPVIEVSVPASVNIMINPLKIPVDIDGGESDEQIICDSAYLANESEVPLRVDVTVAGQVKPGSNLTLVSSPTGGTGTQKNAFVYFEIKQTRTRSPADVVWDPAYDSSKHVVVTDGGSRTKKGIVTLPLRTRADDDTWENGYAQFRLTGDAVKEPASVWTPRDGINVTVAFTFKPLPYNS